MASALLLLLTATCGIALRFQHDGAIDLLRIQMHASGKQEKLSKSNVSDDVINVSGEVEATPAFGSFLQGGDGYSAGKGGTVQKPPKIQKLRSSPKLQRESAQLFHQSSNSAAGVDEASNLSSSFMFSSMSTSISSFMSSSSYSSSSWSLHHACDTGNPFASNGKEDSRPPNGEEYSGPRPGGIITGSQGKEYQYIESLGEGNFGEVWSVTNAMTDDLAGALGKSSAEKNPSAKPKPTAVVKCSLQKVENMSSNVKSNAWGEVCAMTKCADSPYVAKMSDFFHGVGDYYCIVMEFVPGTNLERRIKQQTVSLKTPNVLALIFYDILRGVDYIHKKGVSHRDIKPENVLVTPENRAKLVDFGLASDSTTVKTQQVGSYYYYPPEIAAGSEYFGPEVDVFSLGATLYEMVTGWPAYSNNYESPKPKTAYFPTSHHTYLLRDVRTEIKDIIFCTQKEKIVCSDQEKREGQCRCSISDIMQMSWIQDAAVLDPPAHV